jgi:uroporphyrin-3 C-methyltransferase
MDTKPEQKTQDNDESDDVLASGGESADDAAFDDEDIVAEPPRRPSRLPLITAALAFILSAIALGVVALQQLRAPAETAATDDGTADALSALQSSTAASDAAVNSLRQTVGSLEQSLATIEQRIARLAADDDVAASDIDAIERRLQQQLTAIESVPARVASIERSMSTLRGMSTGAADAWLLAQAEYFLQVANAELELAKNPDVARKALEMADDRLLSIGDPGLTDVRRTLSAELRALESIEAPDIAGTAVTLASLARVVDTLPIRRQLLTKLPEDAGEGGDGGLTELSGTERAMATLREAFSGIVSVRRTDQQAEPLIAPEAVYFLRTNLALQLQAARLALLRGEQELFEQSLSDAAAWLREYYDSESTPVRSALATIGEIRAATVAEPVPDISESLRLLRQYIAFVNAGRPDDAETGAEPPQ